MTDLITRLGKGQPLTFEEADGNITEPVIMLVVDVHYQCDKLSTPLRTPPFI